MIYKRIQHMHVKEIIESILQRTGLSKEESCITAEVLIEANLSGIDSHGISLISTYVQRIEKGGINVSPNREIRRRSSFLEMIDADGGIGPATAKLATERALDIGKRNGISMVVVNNSNHIGMLGYYAKLIAKNNMIGIVMTNSGPNVAAWGGAEAVMGNNALAISAPSGNDIGFLLDIATGEVACGKIRTAIDNNIEKIPVDWILDKNGELTENPLDFLDGGVVLPFGKHKGYGIAMVIDLLTGVLGGGKYGANVKRQRGDFSKVAESSHTFITINIEDFMDLEQFSKRLEDWTNKIKSSKKAKGYDKIFIPGEIEKRNYQNNTVEGIPVSPKQLEEIISLSKKYNIDYDSLLTVV